MYKCIIFINNELPLNIYNEIIIIIIIIKLQLSSTTSFFKWNKTKLLFKINK